MLTLPWFWDFRFKTGSIALLPESYFAGKWFPFKLTALLLLIVVNCFDFFASSCYFHTCLLWLPFMVISIILLTPGKRYTRRKRGNLGKLHPCYEHCLRWWTRKSYNNEQCPSPGHYRGCIHSLQCSSRKGNQVNWKICFPRDWTNIASYLGSLKTCSFYSTHTQIAQKERGIKILLV